MINHARFLALRLSRIFPREFLEGYPWYDEVEPQGDVFHWEYMGGQWHTENIDGVQFFHPECDGNKLGMVEVWGAGCVTNSAVRDAPESRSASLVLNWTANIDRVLEVLELAVRIGSPESAVCALASGKVRCSEYPRAWYDSCPAVERGTLRALSFACRAPDIYHMSAVVHSTFGLLQLVIRQPEVVRSNERLGDRDGDCEGTYDLYIAPQHDEGPG